MCGIVGQIGAVPLDLAPGVRALRHRGPDDEGLFRDAREGRAVDLGFRRLSILDLSPAGHQPMRSEDGTRCLIFNGEIYNFRALRAELLGLGHAFRSQTDSEVILHGYAEWGDGVLHRLRGMFALALWDAKAERLLVARDRLGIKPLFYSLQPSGDGERLLFGSEIKALLALGVPRELEPRALPMYLRYLYLLPPLTFFKQVRALAPGHKLVWQRGKVTAGQWWDLALPPEERDERLVVEQLRALLDEVVQGHLESDVPLGVFLSGGLDSATLTALTARHAKEQVRTFCMTFGEGEGLYDEREHARAVAEHFGTRHTEIQVRPQAAELLPELVRGFDEPFGNPTALLTWLLARETRQHVTVALAGDGGDEVFLGYPRYQGVLLSGGLRLLPQGARSLLAERIAPLIHESSSGRHWPRRAREFLSGSALPPEQMYESWVGYFSGEELSGVLAPPQRPFAEGGARLAELFARAPGGGLLERASYVDLKSFLPGNLLAYSDRMSMAHSLEVRVPFCDHRLVEFVSSISARQRMTLRKSKRLLRLAMEGVLPERTLARGKLGFNPPMGLWLKGALRPLADRLLEPGRLAREGFFDPQAVAALVREQREGPRDLSLHVWSLLVFQSWQEQYQPVPTT